MKGLHLVRTVRKLYSLWLARELVASLRLHDDSLAAYVKWFSRTKTYRVHSAVDRSDIPLVVVLVSAMIGQITGGVWLLTHWFAQGSAGVWAFGAALLLAYPLITAYGFAFLMGLWRATAFIASPKRAGKAVVARVLEMQVMRLRRRHHFTVVAVAGSVGKTSTKLAIAELLGTGLRVRYQKGNYNDRVTVPLVFFGQNQPALYNIFAWMKVFGENAAALAQPYPYDVVVVEIGTDGPGQMKQFAYLRPDICVLTAITPEHMENFGSLAAVAAEETQIFDYAKQVLVSSDDVPASYVQGETYLRYSLSDRSAENYGQTTKSSLSGQELSMVLPGGNLTLHIQYLGEQGARCALAAAAVAGLLGFDTVAIKQGLSELEPFAGRMRVFGGIKNTSIIDDTYNASPVAVKAALDVLYAARASQRIAVLGSMNEMGAYAKTAHQEVGEYCDAHKLDYVLTLGADAARWIAPAAKARGCRVHSFTGADACAAFVRKHLQERAVVLVKGSQNGVFAEEVVKQLLAQPKDAENLVRQSPAWLRKKARQA